MNENKRMLIFFISVVLIVALILVIAFWPEADKTFTCGVSADENYSKLGSVNYSQYECLIKENSKFVLAVSDGLSADEKEALNEAAEKINVGIYYLNDEVSNTNLNNIKTELENDITSFEDYSLVVIDEGKVTYGLEKNLDDSEDIYDFLIDSGIAKFACGAIADETYENLAKLTYDNYECLYESGDPFVMVVTQSTCGYCEQYLPILNEYVGENELSAYILEIDTMDDEDVSSILSSLSYFEDNSDWGTPLTLAIQDKEVVTEIGGYTSDTSSIEGLYTKLKLK